MRSQCTKILCSSSNPRPVVIPIGQIVKLCVALLRCTTTDFVRTVVTISLCVLIILKVDGHVDPLVRSLEVSVTFKIHELGCRVISALADRYVTIDSEAS